MLQNVRCFRTLQEVPIRPITLLVGENNTGKTSFMGCYQAFAQMLGASTGNGKTRDPFNADPFQLGPYKGIVSGGKAAAEFALGGTLVSEALGLRYQVKMEFCYDEIQPRLAAVHFIFDTDETLILRLYGDANTPPCMEGTNYRIGIPEQHLWRFRDSDLPEIIIALESYARRHLDRSIETNRKVIGIIQNLFPDHDLNGDKGLSIAEENFYRTLLAPTIFASPAVRPEPKRSYSYYEDEATPDPSHFSMFQVRRLLKDSIEKKDPGLRQFFKESGMLKDFGIGEDKAKADGSFRVKIRTPASSSNIMDVGYGVSQVLPILTEIAPDTYERIFLLQQPEVHMHPRGQAALASYISGKSASHNFVIETHSDFMINRFRINIRKKILNPADVALLFFAFNGREVVIRNIELDELGNLLDAPRQYGDFFLAEADAVLGFDE